MGISKVCLRIKELFWEIRGKEIKTAARNRGDLSSWTRERSMPLHDILACTLGEKGLSGVMEVRQYFEAAGKMEEAVSKQDYFKQRRKLNPEVFRVLNRHYLQRYYAGEEARKTCASKAAAGAQTFGLRLLPLFLISLFPPRAS